jgi:hypothetical protein
MSRFALVVALSLVAATSGCATSQNVSLAQVSGAKPLTTVALAPADGNSADMDTAIKSAFLAQGVAAKPALPAGTRKSTDVDAIVDYTDQWRWDLAMYLRWVSINLYDAETGNLLASARWDNSAFHGFQDYKVVVKGLVDEMVAKVRARPK